MTYIRGLTVFLERVLQNELVCRMKTENCHCANAIVTGITKPMTTNLKSRQLLVCNVSNQPCHCLLHSFNQIGLTLLHPWAIWFIISVSQQTPGASSDRSLACFSCIHVPLQWRHNERDSISSHRHVHCLLNCWFRRRSKKPSKLCVTGLYEGNSPVTGEFPTQKASNAENISIWWRDHVECEEKRRYRMPRDVIDRWAGNGSSTTEMHTRRNWNAVIITNFHHRMHQCW